MSEIALIIAAHARGTHADPGLRMWVRDSTASTEWVEGASEARLPSCAVVSVERGWTRTTERVVHVVDQKP